MKGWRGVFAELDRVRMARDEVPVPATEAEAREQSCVDNDAETVIARGVCPGPGP